MPSSDLTPASDSNLPAGGVPASAVAAPSDLQARIFKAISIQRPVVIDYLKSMRRKHPDATPEELRALLEKRYVAAVTSASTGVGASAALPAVGIPTALALGVGDLLFFYETSALFVLATTELNGIEIHDSERARPLILGMLLGQKSQSQVSHLVLQAAGAGGVDTARKVATGTVGKALPGGWGEVLTQQLPDSALAPLATVLAREALKGSAKFGAGIMGKALPFGVGAVVGGVGSFTFGRDVVKAARLAFPSAPDAFPAALQDFAKAEVGGVGDGEADGGVGAGVGVAGAVGVAGVAGARAVKALNAAADAYISTGKKFYSTIGRAAVKGASAVGSAAAGAAGAVGSAAVAGADAISSAVDSAKAKGKPKPAAEDETASGN